VSYGMSTGWEGGVLSERLDRGGVQSMTFACSAVELFRSQWLLRLRHELSSLAQTLELWVRIPLEAWMFVCVYSVCVVLCVGRGLATD
jgi:hypothetical protein